MSKMERQLLKDFPRWSWECTTIIKDGLSHQFYVGGNLHLKVDEINGEYSSPYCFMYW